ncbi:hypothetical protein [Alteromonas antoniana]|uniref:hypothetical protein n=1 Tax=Alteromonas antoniana TaxID=2803813 RepID=UPI001C448143|nr:hypothetical protein [Alteromonas antoniana]
MAQMKVLSAARKQAFNSVPKLTREATLGYFTLDLETKKILRKMPRIQLRSAPLAKLSCLT